MIKIAPSILSADFANLENEISLATLGGADYIHVDIMDGHFVPNITVGPPVVKAIRRITSLPLDVHLMISEPEKYIDAFAAAGADILTIHAEAEGDTLALIRKIRSLGMKAAVSIKPKTPASAVLPLLPELDMVLVMTVEPGFGGQSFIKDTIPKIKEIRAAIEEHGYACDLEADGGIKTENAAEVVSYGVNVIVAGSAIFGKDDIVDAIHSIRGKTEDLSCRWA